MIIKLSKDYLTNELNLPDYAIKNIITGTSRWSTHHEIIFSYDNKFWKTYYSIGATEYQEESPWEYQKEVECKEVRLVEKTVKVWEEI